MKELKTIPTVEKYYGNNESMEIIYTNTSGRKIFMETTNQMKELKPIQTVGKYYRNNKSKEKI
jgi:hypothetical protein